jgi:hypothetical protein
LNVPRQEKPTSIAQEIRFFDSLRFEKSDDLSPPSQASSLSISFLSPPLAAIPDKTAEGLTGLPLAVDCTAYGFDSTLAG